ncbi:MAG: queuosine precursor transporter [Opitutales bacterium]|nr:queuosine precursor transporter [Opitutales bacterium]
MKRNTRILLALTAAFIAALVVSNVIAIKTISLFGLVGPAGIIAYSFTFALTDTLAELFGRKTTQFVVNLGVACILFAGALIYLAVHAPGSPFWSNQNAYEAVLGNNLRIVIACLLAYYTSQTYDVWVFHLLKKLTKDKQLWLRNNLSTMGSQMLDTAIFVGIGFAGTGAPIVEMIIGQYICKLIIALFDTPFVYLLVYLLKDHTQDELIKNDALLSNETPIYNIY